VYSTELTTNLIKSRTQMETTYIREIHARYKHKKSTPYSIRSPHDIAKFVNTKILDDNTKEHFILFCLDGNHAIASYSVIHIGSANVSMVQPREIFQVAILSGATSIIVAHNHPSGAIDPSPEDHKVTARLREASQLLGVPLLDHVIVSHTAHYSFKEQGTF
jgi:DNA repair protein RadC